MNAPLPAWGGCPLEVFHDVAEVHLRSRDSRVRERPVQQAAGRSHERVSLDIFAVAGLLADKHDSGMPRPFTKNGLRRLFIQVAALARGSRGAQ